MYKHIYNKVYLTEKKKKHSRKTDEGDN